jgi:hypothetical protein
MSASRRTPWPLLACVPGLLACASSLLAAPLSAQSAAEVFHEALRRYQAQTEGVAAYTLVQDAMGMSTETRFERRDVDGIALFVPVGVPGVDPESSSPLTSFPRLAEIATYEGERALDDGACHELAVADLSSVDMGFARVPNEQMEFTPRSAAFCVDTETYMMRWVAIAGDLVAGDQSGPATMRIASDDYRDVDGLLVPFRTTVEFEGMAVAPGDAAAAREALEQARAEIAKMPAEQRAAMEAMLEGSLEAMSTAAAGGPQSMTMTVTEVRVEKD